jgi:membrane protein implicated in regulation of membrane protease activity
MSETYIWLLIAVVLAVVELATQGLVTIWFAVGALLACLSAAFGASIPVQCVIFVIVSTFVLVAVRPLANRYINSKIKKTNIDALIGRKLIAKTEIDNIHGTGKVDMDGSTWIAKSSDDNVIIGAGEEVEVVRVSGAKLIVKKLNNMPVL